MTNRTFTFSHPISEQELIDTAKNMITERICTGSLLDSSQSVRDFLVLELGDIEYEVFYCIYLNNSHRVITMEAAFHGTINAAAVYPREIMRSVITHNAAAVIFAHNHPSGESCKPSSADRGLTEKLSTALSFIDVRVLDHFIVAGPKILSFSEQGIL